MSSFQILPMFWVVACWPGAPALRAPPDRGYLFLHELSRWGTGNSLVLMSPLLRAARNLGFTGSDQTEQPQPT